MDRIEGEFFRRIDSVCHGGSRSLDVALISVHGIIDLSGDAEGRSSCAQMSIMVDGVTVRTESLVLAGEDVLMRIPIGEFAGGTSAYRDSDSHRVCWDLFLF